MATRDSDNALELRSVSLQLGERTILNSFSMRVGWGERVRLTGPSGGGKTTVMRMLLGFFPPDAGEVLIGGEPLTPERVWRLRCRLAYVPQEPDLGDGTVQDLLAESFSYRANELLRGNLDRTRELLQRFGLQKEILEKEFTTLSGGEKQRIALLSAVLLEREIFLLDEATTGLDPTNRSKVLEGLADLDCTMLLVTHDDASASLATRSVALPMTAGAEGVA